MPKKAISYALITLAGIFFVLCADYLGFFQGADNYAYDLFFRLRGSWVADTEVTIVAIDERTLAETGKWPIPRRVYATLLDRLSSAKAVVFDVIFAEPSADDKEFRAAIERHGRVILPVYVDSRMEAVTPSRTLGEPGKGHIHVDPDVDGVVRSVFHTLYLNGMSIPSLASVAWEAVKAKPFPRMPPPGSSQMGTGHLVQQDQNRIAYYGPPGLMRRVSAADIISGSVPDVYFRDRVVFVGLTVPGVEPELLTPFAHSGDRSPGVEVQATILSNALSGRYVADVREWLRILVCLLLAALSLFMFHRLSEARGLIVLLIGLVAIPYTSFLFFYLKDIWVGPALLGVTLVSMFLVNHVTRLSNAAALLDRAYEKAVASLRLRPDRTEELLSGKGLPGFLSAGGIRRKLDMVEEITRQLVFEKNLVDTTLSSGAYGILLFAPSGALVLANSKAKEFLDPLIQELPAKERFIAEILPLALDPDAPDRLYSSAGGAGSGSVTLALTKPRRLFLKMDAAIIAVGSTQYTVFVLTDISEIKELELRRADVVNIITHELKQPLTTIAGYAYLLRTGRKDPNGECLLKISQEAARMGDLINTFLDLSRLEAGRREIARTAIDTARVAIEAANRVRPLADQKGITIDVLCPPALKVLGDEQLLSQSLVNLLENAIKYSPPNTNISVEASKDDGRVCMAVRDNGFGIDEGDLPHVFDKFYRIRNEQTRSIMGSGLGLALVKQASEVMGAIVSVQSTPHKGSVFRITFGKQEIDR